MPLRPKTAACKKRTGGCRSEIDRLRDDDAYIEEVARREYDFLRDHELLFDFR
ncbi:MAG: septum formation initiator family protein [Desulfurivibrio sp.]|nr:septum formation initiator family protein [Desulfurivibrio sp.]